MLLRQALVIGEIMKIQTVRRAVEYCGENIHNLFNPHNAEKEYKELCLDYECFIEVTDCNDSTPLKVALEALNNPDCTRKVKACKVNKLRILDEST